MSIALSQEANGFQVKEIRMTGNFWYFIVVNAVKFGSKTYFIMISFPNEFPQIHRNAIRNVNLSAVSSYDSI